MRRLISAPHSLARLEYQRQMEVQGKQITYDEFKHETLRAPRSLSENDRFFAVRRGSVSLFQFQCNLQHTLKVREPYQLDDPELNGYWQAGVDLMAQIIEERYGESLLVTDRREVRLRPEAIAWDLHEVEAIGKAA